MAKSSIREQIDPNGTLPAIDIEEYEYVHAPFVPGDKYSWRFFEPNAKEWSPIGHCTLWLESTMGHFDGIELDPEYRGRGLGLSVYTHAIEFTHDHGLPFMTQEASQSPDAVRIWKKLAQIGVASVLEDFRPLYVVNGIQKYTGKYIVNLP